MKQLQQALINAGLVAHLDDDNIMLVGHRQNSITMIDILKVIYPEQLDSNLDFVQTDGIVKIFPRSTKRRTGNSRGPVSYADKSQMFDMYFGPVLDEKMRQVHNWFKSMSPEARMMQLLYRFEDHKRDQQIALERSAGE